MQFILRKDGLSTMSMFEKLLGEPLPSTVNSKFEATDDGIEDTDLPKDTNTPAEECGDIDNPEVPAGGDEPAPAVPPVTPAPEVVDELPPEEDQRVDDAMNAIATPLLIADEMDDEEIKEFAESTDAMILEAEGLLTERTIIKFDKHAKKAQLYEVAVAACAREHKDPLWRKLETVYKMERILKAKLRKKYNGPATRKVKEYLARAKKSKSGVLSKIASKVMGVFHKK
jgi:hypothetical protein